MTGFLQSKWQSIVNDCYNSKKHETTDNTINKKILSHFKLDQSRICNCNYPFIISIAYVTYMFVRLGLCFTRMATYRSVFLLLVISFQYLLLFSEAKEYWNLFIVWLTYGTTVHQIQTIVIMTLVLSLILYL